MAAKRPMRVPAKKKPSASTDHGRGGSAQPQKKDLVPPHEPTPPELAVLADWLAWFRHTPPVPRVSVEANVSSYKTSFEHPDQAVAEIMLANAFGTRDPTLARGLRDQLANVSRTGKLITADELNYMISLVRGIGPRDPTEGMLAAQMAAIHNAAMVAARRLNHVENIEQQNSASSMLNKLTRTFAAQVETLKRYRSSGEQTIKVQHVTVNDGGQAIVGNVLKGGGSDEKNGKQSHEPGIAPSPGPALLGHIEANGTVLPGPGGARKEGVPLPRGACRGTEGRG